MESNIKKTLVFAILLVIILTLIIGALFLFKPEKELPLVEYLPENVEMWLWQGKTAINSKTANLLKIVGMDAPIATVLQNSDEEIVVYKQAGKWFKLERSNFLTKERVLLENSVWTKLYGDGDHTIIGYLEASYSKKILRPFKPLNLISYYFIINQSDNFQEFYVIDQQSASTFNLPSSALPQFSKNVVFAAKMQEKGLTSQVLNIVKDNIQETVARNYPVVVSTKLPDGTYIKEKLIKPELLFWQNVGQNLYRLNLNTEVVKNLEVADQLSDFSAEAQYLFDKNTAVAAFGFDPISYDDITAPNLVYLQSSGNFDITAFDILGKSEGLQWLQDLHVQSIIVEEGTGVAQGRIVY